jgi:hypothetical protein
MSHNVLQGEALSQYAHSLGVPEHGLPIIRNLSLVSDLLRRRQTTRDVRQMKNPLHIT